MKKMLCCIAGAAQAESYDKVVMSYPDAKRPYPTLYFLPGFSASAEEIAFALPLRQMSALYGVAVVVPDGENAFYTDHPERALSMGEYIGEELVEISRKMFPCLSHEREDTFIGGISMGGYGAAALGLYYAERFAVSRPVRQPGSLHFLSPAQSLPRRAGRLGFRPDASGHLDVLRGGRPRCPGRLQAFRRFPGGKQSSSSGGVRSWGT